MAASSRPVVAHVVLSHENPGQLRRLVSRLLADDPQSHVIVQHDQARSPLDIGVLAGHAHVHVMPAAAARRWGRYSLTEAMLQALEWTYKHVAFDWLMLLSGQDYPIRSLAGFGKELEESSYDAFVGAERVPAPPPLAKQRPGRYMQARYYYRWYELSPLVLGWARSARGVRLARALQRRISFAQPWLFLWTLPRGGGDMIGVRRLRVPFSEDFACYCGSQWMTLSRRAVAVVSDFVANQPEFITYYRRTLVSDESLVATIVCNSDKLRVSPTTHHYVQMTGEGTAHSALLTTDDLDVLLSSGQTFARKFDDRVDSAILDELDAVPLAG